MGQSFVGRPEREVSRKIQDPRPSRSFGRGSVEAFCYVFRMVMEICMESGSWRQSRIVRHFAGAAA